MPWFKVDDKFHSHPKVMELTTGAVGLWTLAGAWCADYLTDGEIRRGQIRRLGGTEDEAAELVEAGLWETVEEGWQFRDWHDYQPTRESVEGEREAARERQRKRREQREKNKRDKKGVTEESQRDTGVTHAPVTDEFVTPVPVPVPEVPKGTSAPKPPQRKKPETRIPDDWQPTEEHQRKARTQGVDLNRESENFRLHAEANDRRQVNWNAAFTMWLNKARPDTQRPSGKRQTAYERELQISAERHERIIQGDFGQTIDRNDPALWTPRQIGDGS